MQFKAVIFDLDGTLLDTLPDLADAVNRALAKFNLPTHEFAQYKLMVGEGVRCLIERAVGKSVDLVEDVLANFFDDYQQNWAVKTAPYDGVDDLLTELTTRKISLCVLSNKPHRYIAEILAHFFPTKKFFEARGQYPNMPRKPDPWGALQIAEKLCLSPAEILYVGDSGVDMQTAVAAGMFPCGVSWGFRETSEIHDAGARTIVNYPAEILQWFTETIQN